MSKRNFTLGSRFQIAAMACAVLLTSTAHAEAPTSPVGSRQLFIPEGFDDNDQITVVLDGYLPNSCYKLDRVEKTIDVVNRTITLQQFARVYPGPCMLMLIPFSTEVNLGILPHGGYSVSTNRGNLSRNLTINTSNNAGPDDFLYAPVDHARVEKTSSGSSVAIIEGRFTNTCMSLTETRVIYSGTSVEVLPIIELAEREDCSEQIIPFKKIQPLAVALPGRYLLHVRSLNGKAINYVFPVFDSGDPIF